MKRTQIKKFRPGNILRFAVFAAVFVPCMTVAEQISNAISGGSMIVTFKDDVSTLDPAIGYDPQNYSMIRGLFDGLMDYAPGTTELMHDLARSHTLSNNGLTYTFLLRRGVTFHNGRELTAEDVKFSLDRVTKPELRSPGAGFFSAIKGFDAVADGSASTLSGVTVVDPHTLRIELNRPDATFLHVLAMNFAFVVPEEVVEEYGADFGRNPMGSGAFRLAEWTLGQRLVFVRYADYWREGLPKLDSIVFEFGQEPIVALLRLQKGEVDIPGDGIPPAKFLEVMHDPRYKDLIVEGGQLQTGYISMNVNLPPFDQLEVRQAVNMAINKERIIKLINGRAVPARQPLPPGMPGYADDYEGYAYDPAAARQQLAKAGFKDGFDTELYVYNTDPNPRIAQAIQQDLEAIGIRVAIRSLAQANVIAAGGEPDQAPMIWSGGMGWFADFPDPSSFYGPILGCAGAVRGGWNWAWYCNEDLDARAAEADSMTDPDRSFEREALWREIYLAIMQDAPWVPVLHEHRFTLRSAAVDGPDEIFVDPVSLPVNYEYVYSSHVQ